MSCKSETILDEILVMTYRRIVWLMITNAEITWRVGSIIVRVTFTFTVNSFFVLQVENVTQLGASKLNIFTTGVLNPKVGIVIE